MTRADARALPPLTAWLEGVAAAAEALAAGDAGRSEVAARGALAARPRGAAAARADLALGLALRDAGRHAEAAVALARAQPALTDPALALAAAYHGADATFYAGDPGRAAALLGEVARGQGELTRRARWRRADALLQSGQAAEAIRAYRALLGEEPGSSAGPGARLMLGEALRASGDAAGAVATWRALWAGEPADPAGRAAARALRAWRDAGGPVPPPTAEERLARAGRFLELSLPRRALAVLDRLDAASPPPDAAARAALLRALALLAVARRDEAEVLGRRLAADPNAADGVRAGAELVLARAEARSGRVEDASRRYARLARWRGLVPGLPPAQSRDLPEEAAYLSAWLFFDAHRYGEAVERLRAYLKAHASARRADDARWFEAWALVKLGRRDEARSALDRLAARGGGLAPQALYWRARLERDPDRRRALDLRVAREAGPSSWYGLLAAARLGDGAPPPSAPVPATPLPDGPGAGAAGEALARAARLLGAGLAADAVAELRALAAGRDVRPRAAAVAQLAEAAGDAELPFRMARDHLAPTRRVLRWLYPRAFPGLLPAAAARARADEDVYLAIMRRESAFRPDARSAAGAIGLVQLIPPTAERLGAVLGVRRDALRHLELPEVSVPLGAAYLGLLAERFGDPALVVAAYNAGPVAVARWARAGAGASLDAWVEDIPFRETRRYVKNVTADAATLRALWGRPASGLDPERPVPAPREGVGF
jgi:soluble lytic murein transglycosylase